jgi:Uma2 family endonuclease
LTPDRLLKLSSLNKDLRLELTARRELIVIPPTGTETGDRDSEINTQLRIWAKRDGIGVAFGSPTGFVLPNGALRSPDASWVRRSRWASLTAEQRRKYAPCAQIS